MNKFILIIISVFFGTGFAYCQAPHVSINEMRAEMDFLCDESLGGRGFATPELQMVTFYLVGQFSRLGLDTKVQSFTVLDKIGRNVIAVTPGDFKHYIVLCAYYDGLGTLGGKVYPGADSNASGVAALLCIAASLRPKGDVGVIFLALDGHNASLCGSQTFVSANQYKLKAAVNLDILGSDLAPVHKGVSEYLMALGGSTYRYSMNKANEEIGLDITYDYYGSSSFTDLFYKKISDQRYFLEAGIPSVMFTSGISEHTNKVSDRLENINFELLTKRTNFILNWIQELL